MNRSFPFLLLLYFDSSLQISTPSTTYLWTPTCLCSPYLYSHALARRLLSLTSRSLVNDTYDVVRPRFKPAWLRSLPTSWMASHPGLRNLEVLVIEGCPDPSFLKMLRPGISCLRDEIPKDGSFCTAHNEALWSRQTLSRHTSYTPP